MKKRRISKINSFAVIMLIISFLVGFCGVGALFDSKKEYETTEQVSTIVDESNIIPDIPQKDDDKDEVQPVSAIEYVEKSLGEYVTDNNISSDIAQTTITGSGTKKDPYIINSTSDFMYFAKYKGFNDKYVELGSDIILNDEIFDGEGNISGGDGIIYNGAVGGGTNLNFDGKGHTIKGLYMHDPNNGYISFFTTLVNSTIKNLNFDNLYISGGNRVCVFAHTARGENLIKNCTVGQGVIKFENGGYLWAAGFVCQGVVTIENCVNRASIAGSSNAATCGGIAASLGTGSKIINCKNYGKVYGKEGIGGIAGDSINTEIINCENYGKITSSARDNYYVGGISGKGGLLESCINYGEVNGGGIVGFCDYSRIFSCKNYGKVVNGIFAWHSYNNNKGTVIVDNCANYYKGATNYFGYAFDIVIKNCHITAYQNLVDMDTYVQGKVNTAKFINCKIKIDKSAASQIFISKTKNVIIRDCELSTNSNILIKTLSGGSVELKNVIWNSNNEVMKAGLLVDNKENLTSFEKEGVLIHNYDDSTKTYDNSFCGSNLKDFYISWKTGKIGLTQLDGTGAFQDIVNVTKLKSLGYTWEDDLQDSTYTQLEYIESTGEQYIDTGVVITNQNFNSLRIEIDAVMDVDGTSSGRQLNGTVGAIPYCGLGLNNGVLCYGNGTGIQTTYAISMTTKKKERHLYVMDYKNKTLSIDGQKITDCIVADLTTRSFSANFYIFAANSNGATNYTKSKQHSVKMYVNDKLVRDFIPVVRDADGKVCMYDLVEKKFYVNFGTGRFIAGNKTN